jgi:hypothetical protein
MEAERLTMAYVGGGLSGRADVEVPLGAAWTDPGSWTEGGMIDGHDFSGYGGDIGGGGDFGGGDGGGGGDG